MIDLFLVVIALIWLAIASYQDIRKREVWNWLNFSLIAVALAYRAFYSAVNSDLWYFVYGLIGLGIFVSLAYLFYYLRVFAGGDAKLLMGLGAILPGSDFGSLIILAFFILIMLVAGGIYGLICSGFLTIRNWKQFSEEFAKQLEKNKKLIVTGLILAVVSLFFPFYLHENLFFFFPLLIFLVPWLYAYAKSVEEACMIKIVSGKQVTVGDWLYENVRVKGKIIRPYWEGLSEREVLLLKNAKKIKIKQGIPFVPAFLISFVLLLIFENELIYYFGLFF